MDTIIYLYQSRESVKFVTEKWQEKEYCLIRLGVPVLLWKNLQKICEEKKEVQQTGYQSKTEEKTKSTRRISEVRKERESVWYRIHYYFAKKCIDKEPKEGNVVRKEKKSCREEKPKQEEVLAKRVLEKQICGLLVELREVQTALCLLGDNPDWTYCVYEGTLREKIDMESWRQYWNIPEFEEYHELVWVQQLMEYAIYDRYVILGYAPCLGKILGGHAKRMRSVIWYLKREQYTQAVQDFLEDFYEEYGLVVEVHLQEAGEEWVRVRPASIEPVNVLDFSGEEKISACDVAKGSIWLDMDSLDGKYRRIETRNPGIHYFSLKKQWKQRQKDK